MKRKIILILIIFFLSISYADSNFTDVIEGAWYYDIVTTLGNAGVISGVGNQLFAPDNTITVEQFITLSLRSKNIEPSDTNSDYWADGYIDKALILGWVQEDEFQNYKSPINRGEMARICLRALNIELEDDYIKYSVMIKDLDDMTEYWQNISIRAYASGIMSGYPDGTFRIESYATRAEASALIIKLYDQSRITSPEYTISDFDLRKEAIRNAWDLYEPLNEAAIFVENPVLTAPYLAGSLTESYKNDAINMLNFIRFLSDLLPVSENKSASDLSQHGAVLNAVSEFSHTPSQPSDMDDNFYSKGYNATSSGNLAAGISPLSSAVKRLVDDEDIYNIERVGHRRWFLLPNLKEVGLGYVEKEADDYRYYSVVKVFNGLDSYNVDYNSVYWPSETAFPLEFFESDIPWSTTLNPSIYDNSRVDDVTVTLSNLTTGENYYFDSSDKDLEGEFFNVETNGYGVPYCIIFRPDPDDVFYQDLHNYHVLIENIYFSNGLKTSLSYETTFFDMIQ